MLKLRTLSAMAEWWKRKTGQDLVLIAIVLLFFIGMRS
jgi:hypothetical protein